MAIPRKQIGWSQESNLLWEISRQMEKLTGVAFNGGGGGGGVQSVTGLNTDNTDPLNPIVQISVDGTTITGDGTPGNPLVSVGGGGGTVNVDGVTIGGDGSLGSPLKTLMPVYFGINLTSDYYAPSEGIYEVTVGTDFGDFHAFNPPDPSSALVQGKRIVVTNKDQNLSVWFNGTTYFRGTTIAANTIPPGATYEYISMAFTAPSGWYWVCISPDYVVYSDLSTAYEIKTYGTYTFIDATYGKVTFPNPALFSGQEITIINKDLVNRILFTNDGNNPVYQGITAIPFPFINSGMTVKFISDGVLWRSEPCTQELVFNGINLSISQLTITTPGCYIILNPGDGSYSVSFPDTVGYEGQTITLWNNNDNGWAYFDDNGFLPKTPSQNLIEYIDAWTIMTFKCMAGLWILVNRQQ